MLIRFILSILLLSPLSHHNLSKRLLIRHITYFYKSSLDWMSFVIKPKTFEINLPCLHVVLFENILFGHFPFRKPNELCFSEILFFTHLLSSFHILYHPRTPTRRVSWPILIACYFLFGYFIFLCRYIVDLLCKHRFIFLPANNFLLLMLAKRT